MNIPYILNPLWWFFVFMPKPVLENKKEAPKWEMEIYETYQTRVRSVKKSRKEAEKDCFRLFNIHAVPPLRTRFKAKIKEI